MKKLFSMAALLLIAFTSIFVFPYSGQADEASNQKDAESVVFMGTYILGEPQSVRSQSTDPSNDGIGTRVIIINKIQDLIREKKVWNLINLKSN